MGATSHRPYRLGLDIGTNSLGWFLVWLERDGDRWQPVRLGPGGVRVFPDGRDPQSGTSNAVDRRTARGARKRRDRFADRYFGRRTALMDALIRHGLMPADVTERKALEQLDPYELRAKAIEYPLPAHHVGRTLFHLNQRRGFLSNRKTDKKDDDKGAIKQAASKLKQAMEGESAQTLGEFLWRRHQNRDGVRARAQMQGTKASYDFYPTRDLLKDEFQKIWSKQAKHHASMTEAAREEIVETIFFQRPLKQPPVGKCSLDPATEPFDKDPEGYRCPWAHPLAQRFRIYQEVRNLEVGETGRTMKKLTKAQGDAVALALLQNRELKFDKLRTVLKLPAEAKFNLESERRVGLDGDETAARLSHRSLFGKTWRGLDLDRQIAIAEKLLNEADETKLVLWLKEQCGLDTEAAERIVDAQLPEGHCRIGLRAIKTLLPLMESGLRYDEAATKIFGDHAKLPTGEIRDKLPYYGEWLSEAVVGSGDRRDPNEKRFGRLPNPTVHIGLGQLRRLVNGLIDEFGAPTEIAIEFTRALKLSPREKTEYRRDQQRNQEKNEARAKDLAAHGLPATPRNLLKMRLWEELNPRDPLDRKCPFTGEQIGLARLMSDEVEIEHLIPFKECLDDSAANKTVCMRYANRAKRKQWPYQAFGSSPTIDGFNYRWDEIAARAALLPRNKRWRFDADAREQFEKKGGFLSRQLNETGWLARLAKQYLGAVTNPYDIWVVPGRLTSMIRGKWGLNALLPDHNYAGVQDKSEDFRAATDDMEFSGIKNRADHRHHAIDGLVAALTDRSLLWKMANAYDEEREKIEIPTPWDKDKLREDLKAALDRMVVSHKPDHGVQGKLHEDTAYGFVKEEKLDEHGKPRGNLVYRKPFASLNENEIERICDDRLRDMVRYHVKAVKENGGSFSDALVSFAPIDPTTGETGIAHIKHGLRRVRLLKPEKQEYLVPVRDRRTGKPYKAYSAGENFCIEIYETADGRWNGEAVRRFDANQNGHKARWRQEHRDAKLVMRVHKGDLIRLENNGKIEIMVVHRLDAAARRFKLAPHNETGNLDRRHATDNEIDPFRWLMASYGTLKEKGAVPVRVDDVGRVWRMKLTNN
jgi:CRISPR-associated endonuclease Csn1